MEKIWGKNSIRRMVIIIGMLLMCPMSVYGFGDIHLYAFPGSWAQDIPTTWVTNVQLRYFEYDRMWDASGDSSSCPKVEGFQSINKIAHSQRLSEQWQLTNVLIAPFAHVGLDELDVSASGMGDPIMTNYIGWHNKPGGLHLAGGFSLAFPLGDYDTDDLLNIGENRWKFYFPFLMLQYRKPVSSGLLMFDLGMNCEWRYENHDTDYDEHDVAEINLIATYWLNKDTMKLGFFIQPDYQFALNESELNGVKQNDDDFYTFGSAFGITYAAKPNSVFYLKYSTEFDGENAAETRAIHFQWAYVF